MPKLTGVLALTESLSGGQVRNGFLIDAQPEPASSAVAALPAAPSSEASAGGGMRTTSAGGLTLWQALLFAIIGGLILNLMPCVLPILSLKVMALASHGGGGHAGAARGGFAYLVGVMMSFAALAGVLLALRGAGEALGWGFQFQSPAFVLVICALFLGLALSMSGVFEIGGSVVGIGEGLTRRGGLAGSFFTGVLATIAATPCTAPFMGAAIGFALTRPAFETVVVLQALGVGFALPIFALSVSGAAHRLLPKPGPWMNTLKQLLAFPLYATVAWLVWVLSVQSGSDGVLAAAFVLVGVGFGAWLLGRTGHAPLRLAAAGAAAVLAFGFALAQFDAPAAREQTPRAAEAGSPDYEAFSEQRLAELRAQGRPVFVNLTAAWCISCKVNERLALQSDGFRAALRRHNAVYLKGDWTNRDDAISRVLKSFGRAGVPLYVLYPADGRAEPIVLPQLLTEAIVVRHFAAL